MLKIPANDREKRAIGNEQVKREFFAAAKTGDYLGVRKGLASGLSANLSTSALRGVPAPFDTPIIAFAAKSGDSRTVEELIRAEAVVSGGKILDHVLIDYLKAYPFRRLGHPKNDSEWQERTDIYENGVASFIKAGASIDAVDSNGKNALMIAANKGHMRSVRLLAREGIPINSTDKNGYTPFVHALLNYSDYSKTRLKTMELLLELGADVDSLIKAPGSHFDCRSTIWIAFEGGDVEMIRFLIKNKANVNLTCYKNETLLQTIKRSNRYMKEETKQEIIRLLEEAGAF